MVESCVPRGGLTTTSIKILILHSTRTPAVKLPRELLTSCTAQEIELYGVNASVA